MKSLAICIPTYKRPEMLRQCIESAVASASGRNIAIYVGDDSLSDINDAVLNKLQAKYSFLHAVKNEVNLGIDRNIQRVLDLASEDYLWLIGEDDQFIPGQIARIFDLLQEVDQPYVFSNYQYVSEDHGRVIGLALKDVEDGPVTPREFIEQHLWAIGFIGGCIMRRETWINTDRAPYDGTYFTHVGRILDMVADVPEVYISKAPAVSNRAQGDDTFTWKKDSFGVFLGFERMCAVAASRNPQIAPSLTLASERYRRKFAYFSMKTGLRLRSEGAFDLRQFRTYVKRSAVGGRTKAWFLLMALTPIAVLKPLASTYIWWVARKAGKKAV